MTNVRQYDNGLRSIDLNFQGYDGVIASYLIEDAGERALIEIGPTSCLDTLLTGLAATDIDPRTIGQIIVTHIHLDHAGAAGTFIRRFPQARLVVHEIGAPHMIDPERLLNSARRIYGDQMQSLWGDFEPVPAANVRPVKDGDTIEIGHRSLTALYTPGHASHHIALHDPDRQAVFTGDVAAVRLQGSDYLRPPTPPPDLDLDLWRASIERLRSVDPDRLYLTHFGPFTDVQDHLGRIMPHLETWKRLIEEGLEAGHDRDRLIGDLQLQGELEADSAGGDRALSERLEMATPYYMTVDGYLRYLRQLDKRANQA